MAATLAQLHDAKEPIYLSKDFKDYVSTLTNTIQAGEASDANELWGFLVDKALPQSAKNHLIMSQSKQICASNELEKTPKEICTNLPAEEVTSFGIFVGNKNGTIQDLYDNAKSEVDSLPNIGNYFTHEQLESIGFSSKEKSSKLYTKDWIEKVKGDILTINLVNPTAISLELKEKFNAAGDTIIRLLWMPA